MSFFEYHWNDYVYQALAETLLNDGSVPVRKAAAETLGCIRESDGLRFFSFGVSSMGQLEALRLQTDRHESALGKLSGTAMKALSRAMDDSNPDVRQAAKKALVKFKG